MLIFNENKSCSSNLDGGSRQEDQQRTSCLKRKKESTFKKKLVVSRKKLTKSNSDFLKSIGFVTKQK